jgi:hypothetical protein
VQLTFFGNTKNSTSCKPHAILWKIEVYSKSPLTKPCTLEWPWGVSENRTPHRRHAPGIHIYVLTLSTFSMPHASFTPPNTSWTQIGQINQYAHHLNLHPTILCPLRLLLLLLWKFCPWLTYSISLYMNPQDFIARLWTTTQWQSEVMATIGHWQSLVNQSKTIRHMWPTSRCLLEEVDRQWHEAQVVFTWMERMGLQQELYGSCFTASPVQGRSERSTPSLSSQSSYSPLLSQPSQFYSRE